MKTTALPDTKLNLFYNFSSLPYYFLQILVVGDSITRGLDWNGFEVRTFPGYTAERLHSQVMIHRLNNFYINSFRCCNSLTQSFTGHLLGP